MSAHRDDATGFKPWFEILGASGFAVVGALIGLQVAAVLLFKTAPVRITNPGELARFVFPAIPQADTVPEPQASLIVQTLLPAAPTSPPASFNPRDLNATLRWFMEARKALGAEFEAAQKATINPLVVEPMQQFAASLKQYDEGLQSLVGRRVEWPARVTSISQEGVSVACGGSAYVNSNDTSRWAPQFDIEVYVGLDEEHFRPSGHSNHDKERTLELDRGIPLAVARTLREGAYVIVAGTIEVVQLKRNVRSDSPGPPDGVEIFLNDVSGRATSP